MKYYLMKEEHYENGCFKYKHIKDVNCYTRSKEIMIYDENKNKIWYSFLFEPKAKLTKLKKSQIQDQLKFVTLEKQNDETLESFHEVSEKVFFEFLEFHKGLLMSHKSFKEDSKHFNIILNKLKRIKEYSRIG